MEASSYEYIIENLHDGLYFVDTNRIITYWNKAAEEITGFSADEVVGKPCSCNILTHIDSEGNNLCIGICPLAGCIEDGLPRENEAYLHNKSGERILVSVRVSIIKDKKGDIIGGAELFSDISSQAAAKLRIKELEKLALVDGLTNIVNRNYLEMELEKRMKEYERINIPFGILFIDIDRFKVFNDKHGHKVGDEVLKFVAGTIAASARPFDIYGRWGGEEFVGIIPNINLNDLYTVGERIRILVENSYLMKDENRLSVTISIGGTIITESDSIDSLIERADKLMYKSKKSGRNRLTTK